LKVEQIVNRSQFKNTNGASHCGPLSSDAAGLSIIGKQKISFEFQRKANGFSSPRSVDLESRIPLSGSLKSSTHARLWASNLEPTCGVIECGVLECTFGGNGGRE